MHFLAQVVANEPVKPRLAKLQQALSHYLPPSAEIKAYVSFVAESGDFWKEDAAQVFNKVGGELDVRNYTKSLFFLIF